MPRFAPHAARALRTTWCQPCLDRVPAGQTKWYDGGGPPYDCNWYKAQPATCKWGTLITRSRFGMRPGQACCACGGGSRECVARYEGTVSGTDVRKTIVTGRNDIELDGACCQLCNANPQCEYWVRDLGSSGTRYCWLKRSAALIPPFQGITYRVGYKVCSIVDGSAASSAYPCVCGETECTKGQRCYASDSYCAGYFVSEEHEWQTSPPPVCTSPARALTNAECRTSGSSLGLLDWTWENLATWGPQGCHVYGRYLQWRDWHAWFPDKFRHVCIYENSIIPGMWPSMRPSASSNVLGYLGGWLGNPVFTTFLQRARHFQEPASKPTWNRVRGTGWTLQMWQFTSVTLLHRADCCEEMLQDVNILIGNVGSSSFSTCASNVHVRGGQALNVPCVGTGSRIQVQHNGNKALSLCGFTAFGRQAALAELLTVGNITEISDFPDAPVIPDPPVFDPSDPLKATPRVEAIVVSGHCEADTNGIYVSSSNGTFYRADTDHYFYFDPDCDGHGAYARWILGTSPPNTSRSSDLDDDGACSYMAGIASQGTKPPMGTQMWRMLCDEIFEVKSMTLEVGDTPDWQNHFGLGCASYVARGWCSNEAYLSFSAVPQECQGSSSFRRDGHCAAFYNYPGQNCVACGKGSEAANCSVIDGSSSSSSYPCTCGTATCTDGQRCTSSSSTCQFGQSGPTQVSGTVWMALSNCTEFIADPNSSDAVAAGVAKNLRLPVSFITAQLECGASLLESEDMRSQRLDPMRVEFLVTIPQASLHIYGIEEIIGNIGNASFAALTSDISSASADSGIRTLVVETTGISTPTATGPVTEGPTEGPTEVPAEWHCQTWLAKCRKWRIAFACNKFFRPCSDKKHFQKKAPSYYSKSYYSS
ncbi:unnamed protein product [Symbiodinium sp. CCMP2456]|nr:unnamed protein product [Symbiodinium sp. CCMP2456]